MLYMTPGQCLKFTVVQSSETIKKCQNFVLPQQLMKFFWSKPILKQQNLQNFKGNQAVSQYYVF